MRSLHDAFDMLLDLPPEAQEDRLRMLDLSPAEAHALRAMLAADVHSRTIIDVPIADAIDQLSIDDHLVERVIGTTVGSFRIVELIGEGGSSIVFRAERAAGTGSQFVALKMLRSGLFSPDAQRRFHREHALLAQLNHPGIARLIEGGISDNGIPYIAMELVEGEPITVATNRRALGLDARLRLFSRLCRTIGAAHAALIVHRDLKPSNVLVDTSGELKVVDFGTAKLLHPSHETEPTQTISLTPEYAAPEQFHPGHQTVAVDVYALGVMLGELVTGKRARGRTPSSVVADSKDTVPEGLPPRETLRQRLRGDIDAIVTMATAEDPALRYSSVEALANDVERLLATQPVLARAPSIWYRARKFVERHRAGVLLTGFVTLGILGSLAVAVAQRAAAIREAANARAQAARADSMRDFMFEAFAEAEPDRPREGPATVLDAVRTALASSKNSIGVDTRARLEMRARLAEVLEAQGDLAGARELFAELRTEALTALGEDDPLTLSILMLMADNSLLSGEFDTARTEIDRLLLRMTTLPDEAKVELLTTSAVVATKVRDHERALSDGRRAMALARQSGDFELQRQALTTFAVVLLALNDMAEAAPVYEEVLTLNKKRFGPQHRTVAAAHASLSRIYRRLGDLPRAEQSVREAIAIDRAIYPGDNWHTAVHFNALMSLLRSKGDLPGAFDAAREAYRISHLTLGDDHPETVTDQYCVGAIAIMLEDYATAAPLLHDALARNQVTFGAAHRETAIFRAAYGLAIAMHDDMSTGTAELERAIGDLEAQTHPDPEGLASAIEKRIRLALHVEDEATAIHWISRLERLSTSAPATSINWSGNIDTLHGATLLASNRVPEAVEVLRRAEKAIRAAAGVDPRVRVEQQLLLATALVAVGDMASASKLAIEARKEMQELTFIPQRLKLLEAELPK